MSIDPQSPDDDRADRDDDFEESEATGEGMPQSPTEAEEGTAE